MNLVVGIIAGVVSGLISSLVFFLILYHMKPKVKVASEVCLRNIEGQMATLVIKIVNTSRTMMTGVQYDLYLEKRRDHSNVRVRAVEPRKDKLWFISKYSKSDSDSAYATLISYRINLKDISNELSSLAFVFSGEHSISGRKVCISKNYTKDDFVTNGMFHQGKDLRIIKE